MKVSNLLKWTLSLLVIPFMGIILYHYQDDFLYLFSNLTLAPLALLITLQAFIIGLGGYPFKILMRCFGYTIGWQHWLGLSYVANLANQILPYRPGIALRYLVLRKHYQLPLKVYSFSTLFYFIILMLCASLMMIIPWAFFDLPQSFDEHLYLATIALASILLGLGLLHGVIKWIHKRKNAPNLTQFTEQIKTVLKDIPTMAGCLIGFGLIQALIVISFLVIFTALGKPLALSHGFFIVGVATFGLMFPITPGNIGVLEALMGGLTQALYGNFGLGFSAVLLYRLAQFFIAMLLGTLFSYVLLGGLSPLKKPR